VVRCSLCSKSAFRTVEETLYLSKDKHLSYKQEY
jgi:hypothetical protein